MEQIQFPADAAVIALLGLLEPGEVFLELRTRSPGRAVNPLQHLVARIAAPIGARHFHELEGFELARAGYMRSAAQVLPIALSVQADRLARRDGADDFGLVVLADFLEVCHRLVARQDPTVHRQILGRDLGHARFDRRQVFGRERSLVSKIVVKAVLDNRADGDLGVGIELLHRVRQEMRRGMPDDVESVPVLVGHDA
jgi:hypothetical protein